MKYPTLIYRRTVRGIKSRLIFILVPLLAACSNTGSGDLELASGDRQGITIPKVLRAKAITLSGTMNANLYCDEVKRTMVINGNVAQGSCTGMSTTTSHTIRIEFDFTSNTYGGPFLLAKAMKTNVGVQPGGTSLDFLATDFDTNIDDDGDQISNLMELEAGANPGSATCYLGLSLIGHCIL